MRDNTKAWIELAQKDLEAAKELFKREDLANVVLFHSQQVVEKCFKAVLEENSIKIPKVHSVVKLFTMIKKYLSYKKFVTEDDLNLIDDIYIDSRYPGTYSILPSGFPTNKDAKRILQIAEIVYEEIIQLL